MPQPFESSTLRILNAKGQTIGTGFLVYQTLAVTCAHVVSSIGLDAENRIRVQFTGHKQPIYARVPDEFLDLDQDVAFLELESVPEGIQPLRLAPTAANRQPFQLVVLHIAGRETEIGKIYHRPWFVQAPLVIAVCSISSQAWVRESDRFNARLIDAAIVADHLILAAANLGLGTCWIAAFNIDAARFVLRLPADVEPVIFTPLGYPADQPGPKVRKPLADLVRHEHW